MKPEDVLQLITYAVDKLSETLEDISKQLHQVEKPETKLVCSKCGYVAKVGEILPHTDSGFFHYKGAPSNLPGVVSKVCGPMKEVEIKDKTI